MVRHRLWLPQKRGRGRNIPILRRVRGRGPGNPRDLAGTGERVRRRVRGVRGVRSIWGVRGFRAGRGICGICGIWGIRGFRADRGLRFRFRRMRRRLHSARHMFLRTT